MRFWISAISLILLLASSVKAETLRLLCKGEGPTIDIARRDALRGCLESVTSRLTSQVDVKSISIETEMSTAYHSEVTQEGAFEGLACKSESETVTELQDQVSVHFFCNYDLSKVHRVAKAAQLVGKENNKEHRIISIGSVPRCSSILIRGLTSRVRPCMDENPVRLKLREQDTEITIRADKCLPKTLKVEELTDETNVVLDRAR